jgi:NAD(P)H dehydrogenase (quinone)
MKVAVTAASGKLGHVILEALKEEIGADNVVGVARSPGKIGVAGIETRRGDYASERDFAEALEGIDTVLIISSPTGPVDRVALHRNVINGAKKAGARKLLYTSVIGNGREADTLYGPTAAINRQTEEDLRASGLEWIVGRNGLYLEIDVAHIIAAADAGVFRNSGGDGPCGYITRDELAVAWAKLATGDAHNGETLNLVGECRSQADLVDIVNECCGLNVRYELISDKEFQAAVPAERGEIVARMITGCYQCIRGGAFDVESDFEAAAGRPAKTIPAMIREICGSRAV